MKRVLSNLTFNHLGLAVRRDQHAITMLEALGYAIGERVHDPLQHVRVRLCTAPGQPTVEIVQRQVQLLGERHLAADPGAAAELRSILRATANRIRMIISELNLAQLLGKPPEGDAPLG